MNILVTGSQGFIGSFLCSALLENGFNVIGVDNYSKYGPIKRAHDNHPNFKLFVSDLATNNELTDIVLPMKSDYIIACAAMIGGIAYFHEFPYDLLATNERIASTTFDAAIKSFFNGSLKRIIVLSSSMVYESANQFPVKEEDVEQIPAPLSSYGFQKLAVEYYAKAAYDQHKLPYTIIRPFNCVGVGEDKAIAASSCCSGNIKLTLSHVLPDLINKLLNGQNPLHILGNGKQIRCFTNGKDIAKGIIATIDNDKAINETFNISTAIQTTIIELAKLLWSKLRKDDFNYVSDEPYKHDVKERIPDVNKAKKILGFTAEITLEQSVNEVINHLVENFSSHEYLQMVSS